MLIERIEVYRHGIMLGFKALSRHWSQEESNPWLAENLQSEAVAPTTCLLNIRETPSSTCRPFKDNIYKTSLKSSQDILSTWQRKVNFAYIEAKVTSPHLNAPMHQISSFFF